MAQSKVVEMVAILTRIGKTLKMKTLKMIPKRMMILPLPLKIKVAMKKNNTWLGLKEEKLTIKLKTQPPPNSLRKLTFQIGRPFRRNMKKRKVRNQSKNLQKTNNLTKKKTLKKFKQ